MIRAIAADQTVPRRGARHRPRSWGGGSEERPAAVMARMACGDEERATAARVAARMIEPALTACWRTPGLPAGSHSRLILPLLDLPFQPCF
jgi:hypothetical protein